MADLNEPRFNDEDAARAYLEEQRWPDGPVCPRCRGRDRVAKCEGEPYRAGLYNCGACRRQFTVTIGTVYEGSKVPLHKWLLATYLLCSSKKGMSAHQLHRVLGLPYKTAWFMAHRVREGMRDDAATSGGLGSKGQVVEADETYFGNKDLVRKRTKHGKPGLASKRAVLGLVERGGKVRTFHVPTMNKKNVTEIVRKNISRESRLMTDESRLYTKVGEEFARHGTVNHSSEQWRKGEAYTNTIEGYFSIFKRGMKGIYQHCGEQHLHRYLAEFDFRYNTRGISDANRADKALAGIVGKRLTYRRSDAATSA